MINQYRGASVALSNGGGRVAPNRSAGFSLIELLLVTAIISFLASIVLASTITSRRNARDAARLRDIRQIRNALELYHETFRSYPPAPAGGGTCEHTGAAYGLEQLVPLYIAAIPRDPFSTPSIPLCYRYATVSSTGSQNEFHLGTSLEDINHTVLKTDQDCNSTVAASNNCPNPSVYVGGFNGGSISAESTTGCGTTDTERRCYDLTP